LEQQRRELDKQEYERKMVTLTMNSSPMNNKSTNEKKTTTTATTTTNTTSSNSRNKRAAMMSNARIAFKNNGYESSTDDDDYNENNNTNENVGDVKVVVGKNRSNTTTTNNNADMFVARAPPPSPASNQEIVSRLTSRKNVKSMNMMRSNSALEHKIVLHDETETETEADQQSYKDTDESMLREDKQDEKEQHYSRRRISSSGSSSSSSSSSRGEEDAINIVNERGNKTSATKEKKKKKKKTLFNSSSDGNSDVQSTKVTIKTVKIGTPNVPIMIKDSIKDESVHGGEITVGVLPKMLDRAGSYTKVLSPRRTSMNDARDYFGINNNNSEKNTSAEPSTPTSITTTFTTDNVVQMNGTDDFSKEQGKATTPKKIDNNSKKNNNNNDDDDDDNSNSKGPSTTPSYKNSRRLMQQTPNGGGGGIPSPFDYDKVSLRESNSVLAITDECEETCLMIEYCIGLREKYLFEPTLAKAGSPITGKVEIQTKEALVAMKTDHLFKMVDGVVHVYSKDGYLMCEPPASATAFFHDLHALMIIQSAGPAKSFCHKRLMLTEQKFNLHLMLNSDAEFLAQKRAPHRDFYNVRKVDTHVHHSACMNQKHLLRFIKSKLKKEPNELVIYRDGKYLNLKEVFESIGMTAHELNIDTLDMRADKNTFHRFDRFNLKYNPCGQSRLREIFIKSDNLIRGRFLAELTKEVLSDLEANKYTMAEYRLSIYGRRKAEWDSLAAWVLNHGLFSKNIVWMIQLPRLYNIYKAQGTMKNFQQMLDNIFMPLFEVTIDPSSHPELHHFLKTVVGFDMVDDESKPERRPNKHMRVPEHWDMNHNPAYSYYAYYVYANLYTLNKLRESRGMNVISFRPHAGEAGDIDHLATTFMLAENIAHGINLRKSPVLQYLYYLTQIGLNMSPLSNNSLFVDYHRNPFPLFFARGLAVTLSTDDPLQIHMTKEPLVEEYSVAAQVWKLSAADLCEIARNSVLNSGFPREAKKHWISEKLFHKSDSSLSLLGVVDGDDDDASSTQSLIDLLEENDIEKTNVPDLRIQFRCDVLEAEKGLIRSACSQARKKGRVVKVR